jgi:hypothetical protein
MFCKKCAEELEENAKFCSKCGAIQPEKELPEPVVAEKLQEKSEKDGIKSKPPERKGGAGVCKLIELEEETIDRDIHISSGGEKKYHAKNIRLNAEIHCEGELILDNCVITYNGDNIKGHIILGENTILTISHCTVVGKNNSKRAENPEGSLIEGHNNTSKLIIENSLLFNCLSFSKNTTTQLTKSIIRYSIMPPVKTCLFECAYESDSKASDCLFESLEEEILERIELYRARENDELYEKMIFKHFKINTEDELNNVLRKRSNVDSDNAISDWVSWYLLDGFNSFNPLFKGFKEISGCTFKNLAACLYKTGSLSITQCQFVNCLKVIKQDSYDNYAKFLTANCTFDNCIDIFDTSILDIRKCQFLNCSGVIIKGESVNILSCQFYRIKNGEIKTGTYYAKDSKRSNISQCLFDGILITRNSDFISAEIEKDVGIRVTVDNCEFKHCITQHPSWKIIECNPQYITFFSGKYKRANTISVQNCRGLENVNK